jgi:hypothetical protein
MEPFFTEKLTRSTAGRAPYIFTKSLTSITRKILQARIKTIIARSAKPNQWKPTAGKKIYQVAAVLQDPLKNTSAKPPDSPINKKVRPSP